MLCVCSDDEKSDDFYDARSLRMVVFVVVCVETMRRSKRGRELLRYRDSERE